MQIQRGAVLAFVQLRLKFRVLVARDPKKGLSKNVPLVNPKRGRPSDYDEAYHTQYATSFCLLGATNEELCERFEIDISTLKRWMVQFPKFRASIKEGRAEADANVAKSLYRSALGYSHPETKVFYDTNRAEIVTQQITKHYPPNNVSIIFWLKNRRYDLWKDRKEESDDSNNYTVVVKGGLPPMEEPDAPPLVPEDKPKDLVAPKQPKPDKQKRQLIAAGQPTEDDED